jgi:hypothetical protein
VVYRNEKLQLLPSYKRLRDFVILIYELITEIPLYLKRIEHIFNDKNCNTDVFLKVRIKINIINCTYIGKQQLKRQLG